MRKKIFLLLSSFLFVGIAFSQDLLNLNSMVYKMQVRNRPYRLTPVLKALGKTPEKATIDTSKGNNVSSLGDITSNLTGLNIVPDINVVANINAIDKSGSTGHSFSIFLSASNLDSSKISSTDQFFIPNASAFGFTWNFTKGFYLNQSDSMSRLALYTNFMYLGKKIAISDSTGKFIKDEISTIAHFKQGIEYMIVPNYLSIYYNLDEIVLLTSIEDFQKYYKSNRQLFGFYDFGIKTLLTITKSSGISIVADLNFIVEDGDVKFFTKSSDNVIPTLKIGISKSLAF